MLWEKESRTSTDYRVLYLQKEGLQKKKAMEHLHLSFQMSLVNNFFQDSCQVSPFMRMYRCKEQYSSCKNETNAKCREDKAMEMMKELNLEQMQEVAGGERHFEPEPAREGWTQHKVTATDTLIRIANRYHISDWRIIRKWNPHINPKTNMIRTGEYLWIKL